LSRLERGILYPIPHMSVQSLVSGSIKLRLALMVLLSDIMFVLLPVVFSRSKVVIMMRFFASATHMTTIHTFLVMNYVRE
jgi:hypothetical protein